MELWIRSQDKERLIKVSTLFVEYNGDVDPTISPYRIVADKCIDLGIYKSKERTLEVLDEIQKLLEPQKLIKTIDNSVKFENAIHIVNPTYETITQLDTIVYKMPEE